MEQKHLSDKYLSMNGHFRSGNIPMAILLCHLIFNLLQPTRRYILGRVLMIVWEKFDLMHNYTSLKVFPNTHRSDMYFPG